MSAHDVYVSADDLRAAVGVRTGSDEQVNRCLIQGTIWAQLETGQVPVAVPIEEPTVLTVVPVEAPVKAAALAVAVRQWNSPQAPFGVLGTGDSIAYVNQRRIPEAEIALYGYRKDFGIA
jgi:hypothetical protein